jgi:lipoprotein NlpD
MSGARQSQIVALVLLVLLSGCSVNRSYYSRGIYHTIRRGETLYRISRTYGVSLATLVRVNRITNVRNISAGSRLYIPGAVRVLSIPPPRNRTQARLTRVSRTPQWSSQGKRKYSAPPQSQSAKVLLPPEVDFIWPIKGSVNSPFGKRGRRMHQGIDIGAPAGTPIRAAEDGIVLFSDRGPGGYGVMVIVRHANGLHSIYAHNEKNLVKKGQRLRQGQAITCPWRNLWLGVRAGRAVPICTLRSEIERCPRIRSSSCREGTSNK